MTASHPPSLVTLTRRTLVERGGGGIDLPAGARVLVAVSGGPDSMTLLAVLAELRAALGFALSAHGVDHGLRVEAAAELDRATEFAARLGVPFDRTRLDVGAGGNLQARARTARRAALLEAADHAGAAFVATAHHADDRAETFLMRLLRGAHPDGLAVLPARSGRLVRPFVRARRSAIVAYAARHGVPWSHDPSNDDPRFLRVRIRREVLPLLEALNPAIVPHLGAIADALVPADSAERPGHSAYPIPRATSEALAALALARNPGARVALPGGLVAMLPPREPSEAKLRPRRPRRRPEGPRSEP
jgi:tRNA(Ile)-lysidine synthase